MPDLIQSAEINTVQGILTNFNWSIVKQEITEHEITLTIKKTISGPDKVEPTETD